MSLIDNLISRYSRGSLLLRFIYINIAVFVVLRLVGFVSFLFSGSSDAVLQWLELPSNFHAFLRQPWTLITYMFSHYDVLHILFNMLWLYWLGRIFLEFFNPRQLGGLYVLGGIGGAALYLACYNFIPRLASENCLLLGASASVLAIVIGVTVYRPDYRISLLFFGGVSLKWIAIITVFIDLIGTENGNIGGNIAHLGGIAVGLWFGLAIKQGHDITSWINRGIDAIVSMFKKHPSKKAAKSDGRRPAYNYHQSTKQEEPKKSPKATEKPSDGPTEEQLDEILAKLKRSGYGALSDDEKDVLFSASRKRFS